MARIRTIKPEFPQSESMGRVSREARLTFILLWTLSDDEGRLRGSSRMLASLLFPYDDDARTLIEGWLAELAKEACIQQYTVAGDTYIQICKWQHHQKVDKPSKSKFPPFVESSRGFANIREGSSEDQGSKDQGSKDQGEGENTPPTPPNGKRKKAKGIEMEVPTEVIDFYKTLALAYPKVWPKQGDVPGTALSVGLDRLKIALGEVGKAVNGRGHKPQAVLAKAMDLYLEEFKEAGRFVVGLGVWLSPTPKEDKPNYRHFLPRALHHLDRSMAQETA